jgi:hypothetical protein
MHQACCLVTQRFTSAQDHVSHGSPPNRKYDFTNYVNDNNQSYFPLGDDPTCRQGLSFGVDSSYWVGADAYRSVYETDWRTYKTYVEQQQRAWTDLAALQQQPSWLAYPSHKRGQGV